MYVSRPVTSHNLLFSHEIIATMQSVVTGKAPINNSGAEDYPRRTTNKKHKRHIQLYVVNTTVRSHKSCKPIYVQRSCEQNPFLNNARENHTTKKAGRTRGAKAGPSSFPHD